MLAWSNSSFVEVKISKGWFFNLENFWFYDEEFK